MVAIFNISTAVFFVLFLGAIHVDISSRFPLQNMVNILKISALKIIIVKPTMGHRTHSRIRSILLSRHAGARLAIMSKLKRS